MKRRGVLAVLLCLLAGSVPAAASARRVALVFGNGAYGENSLHAARQDALSIHDKLVELQFDKTIFRIDASKEEMQAALDLFKKELATADQALVYYSGHAAQIEQANYLLPAEAPTITVGNIIKEAFPVAAIYDALRDGNSKFNLIVLDACRNNPLREVIDATKPCNGWRCGLADPKRAPAGTIVAFSTSPDALADNVGGDGTHSPYTFALLKHMGEPGLPVQELFIRVHRELEDVSQVPWENTSQKLPFMFRESAYVTVTIHEADDEATVLVNGQSVHSSVDGSRTRELRLAPGRNILTLTLFNQKSRRGLTNLQEGWKYSVVVRAKGQAPEAKLVSSEGCKEPTFREIQEALPKLKLDARGNLPLPWDCLPRSRFGSSFFAAAMRIDLDVSKGTITFPVVEPEVWRNGFTLADDTIRDERDRSVAWAVVRQGVRLYADGSTALRPVVELRQDLASAHETSSRAAEPSHQRAAALIRQADDETLLGAITSARHWELTARGGIAEGIRWAQENAPEFRALRDATPRNYAALRKSYRTAQEHNPDAMNELALLSDNEIGKLLDSAP